ncbi:hypothetical protein RCL1_005397 [Eukaryota sp. TZLM3-RCL]
MKTRSSHQSSASTIPIHRPTKLSTSDRNKNKKLSSLVTKFDSTSLSDTALLISNTNCNVTHVYCNDPYSFELLLRQDLTFNGNRQRKNFERNEVFKTINVVMDSPLVPFSQIPGLHPCAFVRLLHGPSQEPNAGLGVFAAEYITKGINICIYHGERITKDQMLRRTRNVPVGDVTYVFQINSNEWIDASKPCSDFGVAKYINTHMDKNMINVEACREMYRGKEFIFIRAKTDIGILDELFLDYNVLPLCLYK